MDEERKVQRRNAFIVGAILLVLLLLAIMLYQIVAICSGKKDLDELQDKIDYLEELKKKGADEIEIKETYKWIYERAMELGYLFDGDKLIKVDE